MRAVMNILMFFPCGTFILSHPVYFRYVAADDVELTERVAVTRNFKDKVVQPILKVSLRCFKI